MATKNVMDENKDSDEEAPGEKSPLLSKGKTSEPRADDTQGVYDLLNTNLQLLSVWRIQGRRSIVNGGRDTNCVLKGHKLCVEGTQIVC